jgi:hypothetical protein
VSSHRLDPVSLVGGVVFLSLGAVGLLQAAGTIDSGAALWAAVASVVGLGVAGLVLSARSLIAGTEPRDHAEGPKDVDPVVADEV